MAEIIENTRTFKVEGEKIIDTIHIVQEHTPNEYRLMLAQARNKKEYIEGTLEDAAKEIGEMESVEDAATKLLEEVQKREKASLNKHEDSDSEQ